MRGIEEILAVAVDLGFLAADIDIKQAFFHSVKLSLTDMVHHELVNKKSITVLIFEPSQKCL